MTYAGGPATASSGASASSRSSGRGGGAGGCGGGASDAPGLDSVGARDGSFPAARRTARQSGEPAGISSTRALVVVEGSRGSSLRRGAEPLSFAPTLEAPRMRITVSYTHLRAHETPEHLVC